MTRLKLQTVPKQNKDDLKNWTFDRFLCDHHDVDANINSFKNYRKSLDNSEFSEEINDLPVGLLIHIFSAGFYRGASWMQYKIEQQSKNPYLIKKGNY